MSVQKNLATPKPELPLSTDGQKYLDAVYKNKEAREALTFFAEKSGYSEASWLLLFLEVVQTSVHQIAKESFGPADTKPDTVLKLVARLRETAQTICTLNEERFWTAKHLGIAKDSVKHLANIMESYAVMLKRHAESTIRRRRLYKIIGSSHQRAEEELFERIEKLTGRKYRDRASSILSVLSVMPEHRIYPVSGESHRKRKYRKRNKVQSSSLKLGHF